MSEFVAVLAMVVLVERICYVTNWLQKVVPTEETVLEVDTSLFVETEMYGHFWPWNIENTSLQAVVEMVQVDINLEQKETKSF